MQAKLTPLQQSRANTLSRMTPAEWDAICKRCGVCCLNKMMVCLVDGPSARIIDKETVYLKRCCDKFDTKTRRCTVYHARLWQSNCEKVTMDIILKGQLLPASCGYVEYIFGPAPYPACVPFNQVRSITDDEFEKLSDTEKQQAVIPESILWNERCR